MISSGCISNLKSCPYLSAPTPKTPCRYAPCEVIETFFPSIADTVPLIYALQLILFSGSLIIIVPETSEIEKFHQKDVLS